MKWEFTPDEFIHVWSETGHDRYPFPLSLFSSVRWDDEHERVAAQLRNTRPVSSDADLSAVLRVITEPESTLTLFGTRKRPVRAYGAIVTNIGVTVVQRPGPDREHGGNVVIETGSPAIVSRVFCAVMGERPKGNQPALVESADRIRAHNEVAWTGAKPQVADHMRRLLRAPRDGYGHLEAQHGLRGTAPTPSAQLSWFDVTDDGRYRYRQRYNDFHIDPISHTELRNEIDLMLQLD